MKVIIFGATGMVGQGVLRECLLDPDIERVLLVGRTATGQRHTKVEELVRRDLFDYSDIEAQLGGYDACFFCLGVSAAGMTAADYTRITYDLTMAAATTLARRNPHMTFIYVSGAGTDSSEGGPTMWARVKGRTENAVLALPFKGFVFRPALIQPMHGIRSKTRVYRIFYMLTAPVFPLIRKLLPKYATTTEQLGRAMINVARNGTPQRVLETIHIARAGRSA